MTQRPNIVMVVADDITPSYHSCYGDPTPTPTFDRLSREGLRAERGYCAATLCCPSRYSLFTGCYTQRSRWAHGNTPVDQPALISQNGMLDVRTPTLAKALQGAGYLTGHVGKWHSRFDTTDFGFAEPTMLSGNADDPAVDAAIRQRQAQAQRVVREIGGFAYATCVHWGNIDGGSKMGSDPRLQKHNVP